MKKDMVITLGAFAAFCLLLYHYAQQKDMDMMRTSGSSSSKQNNPQPSYVNDKSSNYAPAHGVSTSTHGMRKSNMEDPSMLLPKDTNSQWSSLAPQGDGALKNINLLQAGSQIGINTVGSSMRNANLQIRSEPPNPRTNIGPWLQSTIEPDLSRNDIM